MADKQKYLKRMVKLLCAQEGGRVELNAGQAREVIKVAALLDLYDADFHESFRKYKIVIEDETLKKVSRLIKKSKRGQV